jgi:hypothetical protein
MSILKKKALNLGSLQPPEFSKKSVFPKIFLATGGGLGLFSHEASECEFLLLPFC